PSSPPPHTHETSSCSISRAPPATHTLSLHDALPISVARTGETMTRSGKALVFTGYQWRGRADDWREVLFVERDWKQMKTSALPRSEEHTSELQSPDHLVCRLLLEKKKDMRRVAGGC